MVFPRDRNRCRALNHTRQREAAIRIGRVTAESSVPDETLKIRAWDCRSRGAEVAL